jgi:dephospho-CoA kinase
MGYPVHHADRAVHAALRKGGAGVKLIAKLFPESLRRGAIDRKILGGLVFGQPKKLQQLEKILHPLVWKAEKKFLQQARAQKAAIAILEIPLLFETGGEKRFDAVICVTASRKVQTARVLARPGMTAARLKSILARQMPDKDKRRLADFVVRTDAGLQDTRKKLRDIINKL